MDKTKLRSYTLKTAGVLILILGLLSVVWWQSSISDSDGLLPIALLVLMLPLGIMIVRGKGQNVQRRLIDKVAVNASLISLAMFTVFAIIASALEDSGLLSWMLIVVGIFIVVPFCVISSHVIASIVVAMAEKRR